MKKIVVIYILVIFASGISFAQGKGGQVKKLTEALLRRQVVRHTPSPVVRHDIITIRQQERALKHLSKKLEEQAASLKRHELMMKSLKRHELMMKSLQERNNRILQPGILKGHLEEMRKRPQFPLVSDAPFLTNAIPDNILRDELINLGSQQLGRGFVPEEHNISPSSTPPVHNELQMESPKERNTSNWREKLREKVHDKIHKINTIESKGNFYMIYGYILKFNEDGEYCINYAA